MDSASKQILTLICICCFLFLVTACEDNTTNPVPGPSAGPFLYVANQADNAGNLSFIDLGTNAVGQAVAGLGNTPNDIIRYNNYLYVINSRSNDMNVLEITADNEIVAAGTIDLGQESGEDRSPAFADVTGDGQLFISNFNAGTVSVYDINLDRLLAHLEVGKSPQDVRYVNSKIYVCNSGWNNVTSSFDPGTVIMIPAESLFNSEIIEVGINPQFMDVDPSGRLHVVCTGDYNEIEGEIQVISTQSDSVVQYINIGGKLGDIAIAPDGKAYVIGISWGEEPGYVYRYNSITGQILNGLDNPIEVGQEASRIVAASDGAVYVSCREADRVDKIVGSERVASFTVGDQPVSMLIYEP